MTKSPWKQPKRYAPVEPKTRRPTYLDPDWGKRAPEPVAPGHIASRLAIHEAAHAVADFMLGRSIHSIEIGELDGIVRVSPTDDPFDAVVSLLAPHAIEDALGLEPSGDAADEREVEAILRRHVSASAIPQARAVLEEAADRLVLSGPFDTLRRALSKHLKPNTVMSGDEVEEILAAAYEEYNATYGTRSVERHSRRQDAPPIDPWYEVSVGDRNLYTGSSREEAQRVHAQHPRSQLVGSIYGR